MNGSAQPFLTFMRISLFGERFSTAIHRGWLCNIPRKREYQQHVEFQGIRASLKRTYADVTQDTLDYSNHPAWPMLLYSVAFLHTVVQVRIYKV